MFRMHDDELNQPETHEEMRRFGFSIVDKPTAETTIEQDKRLREYEAQQAEWRRRGYLRASDREPL